MFGIVKLFVILPPQCVWLPTRPLDITENVPHSSVIASMLNLKSSLGEPGAVFQLSRSVPGDLGAKVGDCQAGRISLSITAI